ncbi:hypothetical protein D1BOALGB6SA_3785 [Olavius sp. associated proteobacterium Delta 1]|nr:hypothetical protein D1BOALGB6SA_3785 [Olavius sp. associated proteobacterium Delta 1]
MSGPHFFYENTNYKHQITNRSQITISNDQNNIVGFNRLLVIQKVSWIFFNFGILHLSSKARLEFV